jgi:hypothetical protein
MIFSANPYCGPGSITANSSNFFSNSKKKLIFNP